MINAKHTPGPWTFRLEPDQHFTILSDAYGPTVKIADVQGASRPGLRECDANAALIAAAPQLLSALVGFMNCYDHHYTGYALDYAAKSCRAAIANVQR